MDQALCSDHLPIIVGVRSPITGLLPGHYVLVTGRQTDSSGSPQYTINDPGGFGTDLSRYVNAQTGQLEFITVGAVKDPPTGLGEFNISLGTNASLLVTDMNGRQTGFDSGTNQVVQQIPGSAYSEDRISDAEISGENTTGILHMVQVTEPSQGTYQIIVVGLESGTYHLDVHAYSDDGTAQPSSRILGIASPGSSITYQLRFNAGAGGSNILPIASFRSTLSDINASAQLGLIDNTGIANSLAEKISAAERASESARSNILNAFENEINAQSGKHILSTAVQVLLQDASSLLRQ